MDILEKKVRFTNDYLNGLLKLTGIVYTTDIYSVVTRTMRESGKLIVIDAEELLKLTRENDNVEFVKLKRMA